MQSDMEAQVMLLRESTPAAELAARAISSVVNGEVDPITAHINISRMEAAIKLFKENTYVRDITLRELAKYGKSHQFGDCRLEEAESGVKYDYSMCGDSKLRDMYETLEHQRAGDDAAQYACIGLGGSGDGGSVVPARQVEQDYYQDYF